jgi:hypothetical protein
LGALVFQPDDTEKSKWAETKRSDPDSRLCQELRTPANTWLEKRSTQKQNKHFTDEHPSAPNSLSPGEQRPLRSPAPRVEFSRSVSQKIKMNS